MVGKPRYKRQMQVRILPTMSLPYKNTLGLVIDHRGYSAFRAADSSVFLYGNVA